MTELAKNGRRQYLVTYSKADLVKFPTRESFANAVVEEFNFGTSVVKVQHWACCREKHEDGSDHYHLCVKLNGVKRWSAVKERVTRNFGVVVNFSDHDYYLSAYRYVTKSDIEVAHSLDHPNLSEAKSPKTKMSIQKHRRSASDKRSFDKGGACAASPAKLPKKVKLDNSDVGSYCVKNNICDIDGLMVHAHQRKENGEKDLSDYVFRKPEKEIGDTINKAWRMHHACEKAASKRLTRIDLISSFTDAMCTCEGEWLACATEVLALNKIERNSFCGAVRNSLVHGRGKYRNVMLVGPTNCAKTFMFKPLVNIFKEHVFENPANDKFAWVGAGEAKVIMLNDFRWHKECISWKDLLLLLEGETVKLPAPKNLYAQDVCISGDVAIFATGKSTITFKGPYNAVDRVEDDMMASRWKVFNLSHQFSEAEQKSVEPCSRCFADLVLH